MLFRRTNAKFNTLKLLFFVLILFKFSSVFSCHNGYTNVDSFTINGDGTYTLVVTNCIEFLGLEGNPDEFYFEFPVGTQVVTSTPTSISTSSGDNFTSSIINGGRRLRYATSSLFVAHGTQLLCGTFTITLSGTQPTSFVSSRNAGGSYESNPSCTETINLPQTPPQPCGDCSSPLCPDDLTADPSAPTFNNCIQWPGDNTNSTITSYHTITSSPDGTIGLLQRLSATSCANGDPGMQSALNNRRAYLYAIGDCNGIPIAALTTNAGNSATFNPEWIELTPNTAYIIIIENDLFSCDLDETCVDYYYPPVISCGDCTTPDCPVNEVATFADRDYTTDCNTLNTDITNTTYVTHHTVTTDANGNVGLVQQIDAAPQGCATRSVVLRPIVNTCTANDIAPNTANANGVGSGFNPEWYGLTPNTQYVAIITTTVGVGCNYGEGCLNAYGIQTNCNANAGTITVSINNVNQTGTSIDIPFGEAANFTSTGYTLPNNGPSGTAGMALVAFSCPPTSALTSPFDVQNDPCYLGILVGDNVTTTNNGSGTSALGQIFVVFMTFDHASTTGGPDTDADDCVAISQVYTVTYLDEVVSCGDCTTPDCPVNEVATFADRDYTTDCNTLNTDITNTTYVTHHTVTTDANGNVGLVQQIDATPQGCATRSVVLRPIVNTCTANDIAPNIANANAVGSGFNPEWYGLTPNTQYVAIITTTVGIGCNYGEGCLNAYGIQLNCTPPTITLQPQDQSDCEGQSDSFTVTATGGNGYQWQISTDGGNTWTNISNTGGYSGATSNTLSISDNTGLNGNMYQVIISEINATCPTTSNPATLNVNAIQTPIVTCGTASLTSVEFLLANALSGVANYNVSYTINGGAPINENNVNFPFSVTGLNGGDDVVLTVSPNGTGCYDNRIGTCTAQDCTPPTITVQPQDDADCEGQSVNFAVGTSTTANYQWQVSTNGGVTWNNLTDNGNHNGTNQNNLTITNNQGLDGNLYRVICFDASNQCSTTSTVVQLTVFNLPFVTISGDLEVCEGESITLTANNATSYSWLPVNNIDSPNNTTVNITPTSSAFYSVTGTDLNNCTNRLDFFVTVNANPQVNAGNDITSCSGNEITLQAETLNAVTVEWNDPTIQDGTPFTPTTNATYTVTATSQEGCTASDEITVTVDVFEIEQINASTYESCSPLNSNLTLVTSSPATSTTWYIDGAVYSTASNPNLTLSAGGCYTIEAIAVSPSGCTSSSTLPQPICVFDNPVANFSMSETTITESNSTLNFTNLSSTDVTQFNWDLGDGTTSSASNPSHNYQASLGQPSVQITLYVENMYGCSDMISNSIQITEDLIYYVPNAFTPDNNKFNNEFKPILTSGFDPYSYTLLIYNRWGELLFESQNHTIGWDGTYNDNLVMDGTYVWKIEFKELYTDKSHQLLGHVTLIK